MNLCAKLGLGTAQWGMTYGIANQSGQPTTAEIGELLRVASVQGVTLLDTAYTYGVAEELIGEHNDVSKLFQVVTKTLPIKLNSITSEYLAEVATAFAESLQRLRRPNVYGLMVHHAEDLLLSESSRLWSVLQDFKSQGRVMKIGVSVYHPQQLEAILDRYQLDLVQLPFNLYDQRFAQTGLLRRLKQSGLEVHSRSAFLQGLLLLPSDNLPNHFNSIRDHHLLLHSRINDAGISPLEACLQFCLACTYIDKVIVGCESVQQLREVLDAAKKENRLFKSSESYSINDELIINPAQWRIDVSKGC